MGQALYRNYRPKSFDDVIGQDHITKTLTNAIKSGRISHAYLFTGPRGVGKTSVARILAHEVNGIDYDDESIHLDIIEIDAASNRRIDEIRDLRDKVRIAPSMAKYKVYIIDEVHMLTREAFNALLKTLEEPPAHCIFILATTEAHKLPDTIISRTQRFEFKPVNQMQATQHLQTIAKQEQIEISPEALEILAEWGSGSFRDSISYLDQLSSYGKRITADDVVNLLGLPAKAEIEKLYSYLESADAPSVLSQLQSIEQKGVKPQSVATSLSQRIRSQVLSGQVQNWQVKLLSGLLEVSSSQRPQEMLEICLLTSVSGREQPVQTSAHTPKQTHKADLIVSQPEVIESITIIDESVAETSSFDLNQWDIVVERSKKQAASIYTALRLAVPSIEGGVLTLSFEFPLHQKKMSQAKNKQVVSDLIEEVSGSRVNVEAVVDKSLAPALPKFEPELTSSEPVSAISNIFGVTEVLEA
ncbi:DNA polymerase III subunit gamma/tau [Candidatus Saccharibacteria bacterium]|nr:DNA polymerase III subunit gamma/tau [Candidatus Saccharibacteria bacterium]